MKQYEKRYEDLCRPIFPGRGLSDISCVGGTRDELEDKFRSFYRGEVTKQLFHMFVCQMWLERHMAYDGKLINSSFCNGYEQDWMTTFFFRALVGTDRGVVSGSALFLPTCSYFNEFFEDFLGHDPFDEPEYFSFPYKNISLDFLYVVHQVENRLDFLKEAEEKKMKYDVFVNWVSNWILCYNEEKDENIYGVTSIPRTGYLIRRLKDKKKEFLKEKLSFDSVNILKIGNE